MSKVRSIIIIIATAFIAWGGYLMLGPINDDYQIIGHHQAALDTDSNILAPFYTEDISQIYYRPIPNAIHKATVKYSEKPIAAHRYVSLVIYIVLCISFYLMLSNITRKSKISLYISLVYSVLPAHWYYIGWIAGLGDLIIAIAACWGLIFLFKYQKEYDIKYLLYFLVAVVVSALGKEHGYMLGLVPFVFGLIYKNKQQLIFGVISVLLIIGIVILAGSVNTGDLSDSSNISNIDIINVFKNFLIAIPLSALDHRLLEVPSGLFLIIAAVAAASAFKLIVFKNNKTGIVRNNIKEIFLFSVIALLFLTPALPMLMPWYALYLGIPLFLLSGYLLNKMIVGGIGRPSSFLILSVVVLFGIYDMVRVNNSINASEYLHSAFENSTELLSEKRDSIIIINYPRRVDGINTMVAGRQQLVQRMMGLPFALSPDIDTRLPFGEISDPNKKAEILQKDNPNKAIYYFIDESENSRFVKYEAWSN
jgi:hypothetical protein